MVTVFITFAIILLVISIMSVGVIFGRKPICGGGCGGGSSVNAKCAGCEKYEKNDPPPRRFKR